LFDPGVKDVSLNKATGKADALVRQVSGCLDRRTRACPSACPDESQEKLGRVPCHNPIYG